MLKLKVKTKLCVETYHHAYHLIAKLVLMASKLVISLDYTQWHGNEMKLSLEFVKLEANIQWHEYLYVLPTLIGGLSQVDSSHQQGVLFHLLLTNDWM